MVGSQSFWDREECWEAPLHALSLQLLSPCDLSCRSRSLVLVPWASCSLLVSTDISNTSFPVSRKKPQSWHVSAAERSNPGHDPWTAFPIPQTGIKANQQHSQLVLCYTWLWGLGKLVGWSFLGLESDFKAMWGDVWVPRRVLVLEHRRMLDHFLPALHAVLLRVDCFGNPKIPVGHYWKEAGTAFPFSRPWISF